VRERVELLISGGGYVIATMHNIQPAIAPKKIWAIYYQNQEDVKYARGSGGRLSAWRADD
jgi:hypothetical protein